MTPQPAEKPFGLWRIKKIKSKSRIAFHGFYKGHEICIQRDEEDRSEAFYIQVTAPCGMYAYDGWFGDALTSVDDAIREAVKGAMLE